MDELDKLSDEELEKQVTELPKKLPGDLEEITCSRIKAGQIAFHSLGSKLNQAAALQAQQQYTQAAMQDLYGYLQGVTYSPGQAATPSPVDTPGSGIFTFMRRLLGL